MKSDHDPKENIGDQIEIAAMPVSLSLDRVDQEAQVPFGRVFSMMVEGGSRL